MFFSLSFPGGYALSIFISWHQQQLVSGNPILGYYRLKRKNTKQYPPDPSRNSTKQLTVNHVWMISLVFPWPFSMANSGLAQLLPIGAGPVRVNQVFSKVQGGVVTNNVGTKCELHGDITI
jgi:hypothetical protein